MERIASACALFLGLLILLTAAPPAAAQTIDYVRIDLLPGCNLIPPSLGCCRISGGGIPEWTEQFVARGWNNGPNGVPQDGGGDDIDLGPAPVTWSSTPASIGSIDATGLFTGGSSAFSPGLGNVTATHATAGSHSRAIKVVPPDWVPNPLAPPFNLACSESAGDVSLSWSNPVLYDSVTVARDGLVIATLAGNATAHTDLAVPTGGHVYEVSGTQGTSTSTPVSCALLVGTPGGGVALIFAPPGQAGGATPSAQRIAESLTLAGTVSLTVTSLGGVTLPSYDVVFVVLGTYPSNHVLTTSEGTALRDYVVVDGGRVYIEGGDTFAYDAATPFHAVDGINGLADGSGDLSSLTGLNSGVGCDLSGFNPAYTGENAWIDHLAPASASAGVIWTNSGNPDNVGIFYDPGSYRVIGCSYEFGGIGDLTTRHAVMAVYLDCFGVAGGVPPVENLACSAGILSTDLSWANGDAYDSIEVERDGLLVATLPGSAVAFQDTPVSPGQHSYAVIGVLGAEGSAPASCAADVLPPPPPATLNCAVNGAGVDLSWSNAAAYDALGVERDGLLIATLPGSATAFTDIAPPAGAHDYSVYGTIAGFDSSAPTCSAEIPVAPVTGLTCILGAGAGELSWTNGEAYDSVQVSRDGVVIALLAGVATSHSDPSPPAGSRLYEVSGIRDGVGGPAASCVLAVPPEAPVALACILIGSDVALSWTNADSYQTVEIRRDGAPLVILGGGSSSYLDPGAPVGLHDYGVRGVIGGVPSPETSCQVDVPPPPPPPPSALLCQTSPNQTLLSWTNGALYDAVRVVRDGAEIALLPGSATSHTDSGVAAGAHAYDVSGVSGGIESDPASCSVTVPPPPPAPPSALGCAVNGADVDLSWTNGDSYTGLEVRRDGNLLATLPGSAIAFTDIVPPPGLHLYTVVGVNAGGSSTPAECAADVPSGALEPPSNLTCVAGGGDVNLAWTNGAPYDQLLLYRDGALIATLPGGATAATDGGPPAGARDYELVGTIGAQTSPAAFCSVTVPFPVPDPVLSLSCERVGDGSEILLSWLNAGTYDAIEVRRDGALLATLPGTSTSHVDGPLGPGSHSYEVIAIAGPQSSPAATCAAVAVPVLVGLQCMEGGGDALLGWDPPAPGYDAIVVRRDGVEIALLPAIQAAYTDPAPPPGIREYQVQGRVATEDGPALFCEVVIPGPVDPDFRRGDANQDSLHDISDTIYLLAHLFAVGTAPPCLDAADMNDDGLVDIADAIAGLNTLFGGAGPLPPPSAGCGPDPTADLLGCASSICP
ncbi:MAG: hypothetical protein ACE5GW_00850 [Planctomycetota bacterium]